MAEPTLSARFIWDERTKQWRVLVANQRGVVLAKTTVDRSVSLDRVAAQRLLAAIATEMQSWLL